MLNLPLPRVILFGGKKLAGKDSVADTIVRSHGYRKLHIAEPYLREWFAAHGMDPNQWESLKYAHREQIEADAEVARRNSGGKILLDMLDVAIPEALRECPGVVVSGIRFHNEALWAIPQGFLVVKVEVSDWVRRARFTEKGEDLKRFHSDFEREIDDLPCHFSIEGDRPLETYPYIVSVGYTQSLAYARMGRAA